MEKTLTVNISGTVFHIEEDAYAVLQRYLVNVRGQFTGSPGGDEIMADIEARIAELFTARIKDRGMVVTMADVDHVISVMGRPEDYTDGEEAGDTASGIPHGAQRGRHKRLFRDPDDRWVGGVLSGLAAYAGVDPLWFRLAFILLLVLGVGSPIFLYIILWILIPVANTTADRLMMDGEPVTVDNLKKAFEEGTQRVASEVEDLGKRWNREAPRAASSFRSGARRVAGTASTALVRVIGLVLIAIGVSFGLSLLGTVIGGSIFTFVASSGDDLGLFDLAAVSFASASHATWGIIALLLVLAIPVVAILVAGFQLLLDLKAPKWLGWSLGITWFLALIVASWITIKLVNDLKRSEALRTEQVLEAPAGNVLHVRQLGDGHSGRWSFRSNHSKWDGEMDGLRINTDSIHGAWARLDVRRSPDANYHLVTERRTQGSSGNLSLRRSDHIASVATQQDSLLQVSPWLSWPKADRIRGQRVRFIVLVPEGGSVHLDESVKSMLDDVKNVTRTRDRDMVGKTWTMTVKGLRSPDILNGKDVKSWEEDVPQEPDTAPEPVARPASAHGGRPAAEVSQRHFQMPDLLTLLRPRF